MMAGRSHIHRVLILLIVSLALVACVPAMHTVKPLPNFVQVGLAPGDTVTVTTHDGRQYEFVVEEVRGDVLVGADQEFVLADLADIKKHGNPRPSSPCGGDKPLGCSVPLLVSLTSEAHGHYKDKFYDACAQHDYCYRHGYASYGEDRDACDAAFLEDMLALCPEGPGSTIGKVFEVLSDSLDSRHTCELVADDYYGAVRRFGNDRFETANSTYCEYDGPPTGVSSAPRRSSAGGTAR